MTLRVTIEIVPYGDEDNKRIVETIDISNETYVRGPENDYGELCDYSFISSNDRMYSYVHGEISKHRRSDGYYPLIQRVMQALRDKETLDKGNRDVE